MRLALFSRSPLVLSLFVLPLFVWACGGSEAASSGAHPGGAAGPAESPSEARTSEPGSTEAPSPSSPSTPELPLGWNWQGPPLGPEVLARAPSAMVDPGGLTCAFERDERTQTSTFECLERSGARRWGFDLRDDTSAATILRDGETLFVARFSRAGFGMIVERFTLDEGERRWRRALSGLVVPIGGLAVQDVELAHEGETLVVRGWDAGGRWAVALDEATGAVLGQAVFEGAGDPAASASPSAPPPLATAIAWQWDGPELMARGRMESTEVSVSTPDGGRCQWLPERNGTQSDDDRSHLACLDARGRRIWGFDEASPWPDMQGRALLVAGETLFVLTFHRAATGASMTAYQLSTGVERWSHGLLGIGPTAHSGYMAWAELALLEGRPVVFGWEAHGRYVEALDPQSGVTVFHQRIAE